MIKGIIAPPDTAIIISPDISLALSGRYCKARESDIENTFAHTSPIIKIEVKAIYNWGNNIIIMKIITPVAIV